MFSLILKRVFLIRLYITLFEMIQIDGEQFLSHNLRFGQKYDGGTVIFLKKGFNSLCPERLLGVNYVRKSTFELIAMSPIALSRKCSPYI